MDYRKNIENKKTFNAFLEKVTNIAKTADEKIKVLANEAEGLLRDTTTSIKENCQANLTNSFRKNLQTLSIEYVEKTLIANGVNGINSLTIGVKEDGSYLSVERIIADLCKQYNQPLEPYMTDVYKYNLFGSLVLFFSANEQVEFTKDGVEVFTLTLKEKVETPVDETCDCEEHKTPTCTCDEHCTEDCTCTCHQPCMCDINCDETCECACHKKEIKLDINK